MTFNLFDRTSLYALFAMLAVLSPQACAGSDLVDLVETGNTALLLQRVGHGASADEPNDSGELPLVAAVRKSDLASAEILMSYSANASLNEPATGQSAICLAFNRANEDMAELLLKFGANPDSADESRHSAREIARHHPHMLELIEAWDKEGAEAFEDMPGAWTRHIHEEFSTAYYHNERPGDSRFMVPPSCAWIKTAIGGNPVYVNTVTRQSKWTRPRALSWKHFQKNENDQGYWYNYVTKAVSTDPPAELPIDMVSELKFESGSYYHNEVTKEASWVDPAELAWREVHDPSGRKFWFNPLSKESAWDRPVDLSWRRIPSEQHPGRDYYFNEKSKESQWEVPSPMAWKQFHWRADLPSEPVA